MKKMFSAKKVQMLTLMLLCGTTAVMAQNSAGDYSAGTTALATVTEEIAKYVPIMVKLCYAIAGVVAIAMGQSNRRSCVGDGECRVLTCTHV